LSNFKVGSQLRKIFANEIPLGHIDYADFIELVVRQDVRPERPDEDDATQLSDAIWELAEKCWVKDPKRRLGVDSVCDALSSLLNPTPASQPPPSPPPLHLHPNTHLQLTPRRQTILSHPLTPLPSLSHPDGTTSAVENAVQVPGAEKPALNTFDVDALLDKAVAAQSQKLTWRTSVVDLMKTLKFDSSLGARRKLSAKLGYHGDLHANSAEMNIWLHKQIKSRLVENGGEVPNDLRV